jgi:hypothetical protein
MPSRFFAQSIAAAHPEQNSKPLAATITNANTSHRKHSLDLLRLLRYTLLYRRRDAGCSLISHSVKRPGCFPVAHADHGLFSVGMRSGGHRLISVDCHRNGSGCFLSDRRATPGGSPVDARITIVSGLFPLTCARADELISSGCETNLGRMRSAPFFVPCCPSLRLVAQHALENLASGAFGQLIHHDNRLRNLVGRQMRAAVGE